MPRKQKKYHYLYKTTNLINEKFYFGIHSTENLNDGYIGSGTYLWHSINKHGRENFKIEFLEFFEDRKKLLEREKKLVNEELLKDPMCMNLRQGGHGGWTTEQQIINGKKANVKMKMLRETNPEWVKLVSKNKTAGLIEAYKNGNKIPVVPDWTGKTHKEATKKKIGKSNSKHQSGSGNSQFGTCWIHNNKVSKKIKKSELKKYLKINWIEGRKIKF